jgi:two-component system chemotaxis response regulator CheB
VRALIADDSPLFVEALSALLAEDAEIRVVGVASDGIEAVAQAKRLKPNIVIMDVHMPGMNGMLAIEKIMSTAPVPILVLTGDPKSADSRWCFEMLSRGALELRRKPDFDEMNGDVGRTLCEELKFLATVPVVHHARRRVIVPPSQPPMPRLVDGLPGIVAIAASTGGPPALCKLLGAMPIDFPFQVVIVQHLLEGFAEHLVDWLAASTPLSVQVARANMTIKPGSVLLAPDHAHTLIDDQGRVLLMKNDELRNVHCPAADVLFTSVAKSFGSSAIGVVLTGMGQDGAEGLLALRNRGAFTLAQDGPSSVVDGMPRAARQLGAAVESGSLEYIAERLLVKASRFRVEKKKSRAGEEQ